MLSLANSYWACLVPYEEPLARVNLISLQRGHQCGDIFSTFRIVHGFGNVNVNMFWLHATLYQVEPLFTFCKERGLPSTQGIYLFTEGRECWEISSSRGDWCPSKFQLIWYRSFCQIKCGLLCLKTSANQTKSQDFCIFMIWYFITELSFPLYLSLHFSSLRNVIASRPQYFWKRTLIIPRKNLTFTDVCLSGQYCVNKR